MLKARRSLCYSTSSETKTKMYHFTVGTAAKIRTAYVKPIEVQPYQRKAQSILFIICHRFYFLKNPPYLSKPLYSANSKLYMHARLLYQRGN